MKKLKLLFDFFLYSNFFISLCAAAATLQTYISAGEINWNYSVFVFCSTFVFYNLQRILLSKNYSEKFSSERQRWILKNKKLLIILSSIAFSSSIPLFIFWSFNMILIFGTFSVIASFYFLPKINLRTIPGVKAIYIALLWTFSTSFFPVYMQTREFVNWTYYFHLPAIFPLLQRFLFILVLAVAFNIRDISIDQKTGVKTIPALFGEIKTKIISLVLLFLFCGMMPYPFSRTGTALVVSAIITGVLILFSSEKRSEYYYTFLLDGMILLQAGLVFLSTFF